MALSENTRPYEILVRIHADGSASGQRQSITEISRGDEIIASTINPPEELTEAQQKLLAKLVQGGAE